MPSHKPSRPRRYLSWVGIFGVWTLIVLTFAIQGYVFAVSRNRPDSFRHEFLVASTDWYVWAALTPVILLLCRRWRITSQNWLSPAALHLAASLVLSALQLAIQVRLNFIVNSGYLLGYAKALYFFGAFKWHINLLTYWVIVALNHGIFYYEQSRARELAWARMETDLANSQLQALTMQLHPHFLFNTLHSISTLISEEPRTAQEMVLKLGELLRATLRKINTPEVSLGEELELLDCYLAIEQTRFRDRLKINKRIDPQALAIPVPTLVLQPLVENAVRHGIAKHKQVDEITIAAQTGHGRLLLEVRNLAGRMENGADPPRGIGLSNTRARLEQLYGDAHSLEIRNLDSGGVSVKLSFPAGGNLTASATSKA